MDDFDYTYIFDDITDRLGPVQVTNHRVPSEPYVVRVAAKDYLLRYADNALMMPWVADFVDIGLAVYVANRLSRRTHNLPSRILIDLPVRCFDLFSQPQVTAQLQDVLGFYTDDHWHFKFRPRHGFGRFSEVQGSFLMPDEDLNTEVALWSGGLDSLGGLWDRIQKHTASRYVLFGTGPNTFIHRKQREVARQVRARISLSLDLIQVPIFLFGVGRSHDRGRQRSRGFVFLLLGAACALLEGQRKLHVFENGIGALNLSCLEAEVGLDHSRAVHPLALLRMSDLVTTISGQPFHFVNPYLFQTKGELCQSLALGAPPSLAALTISCDRRRRQPDQPPQCGRCSSCLLRKQSLAVVGIEDQTPYYKTNLSHPDDRLHLEAMLHQVHAIGTYLSTDNPWEALRDRYPELNTVAKRVAKAEGTSSEVIASQLVRLYHRYVSEWNDVRSIVESLPVEPTLVGA